MKKVKPSTESHLARYERIVKAALVMTEAEKELLAKWEAEYVKGDGEFGTTDWPGWPQVIARITH
ncbi:TPA: hypothetical protein ACGW3M_001004 [Pseudomonas aeruginosa]|uniref:hypothetical protein n=1 Tax=Pseudomonas aeruginosa TaxID=287 RepID=UPI0027E6C291|nr:hypothetical protein [Pseudomonas aeruginosa]ELJ2276178.1 hypothetical protein [Pseudomonas aeruginosa]MCS8413398.1 hypothetical protein [Pseudomonas aeruginosa]MCS9764329.1 hypothetical protein [Pseudomonas aeruginosa]MCS9820505.1 hypothetical protein [Pseudomonas aeruginosa]